MRLIKYWFVLIILICFIHSADILLVKNTFWKKTEVCKNKPIDKDIVFAAS